MNTGISLSGGGLRAGIVSRRIKKHWGIDKSIRDLPVTPRWIINATCYETSRNWRFETNSSNGTARMGGVVWAHSVLGIRSWCELNEVQTDIRDFALSG